MAYTDMAKRDAMPPMCGTDIPTLDELLERWTVHLPGTWENENTPTLGEWYAVSNDDGIIAYFGKETDALRFRLAEINRTLNG